MKYVSLDLETTCLAPKDSKNILMVSMVVEDTEKNTPLEELPSFTCFIKNDESLSGSYYALAMNGWILDIISGRKDNNTGYEVLSMRDFINKSLQFLDKNFPDSKSIVLAGKNVASFDYPFLPKVLQQRFKHRMIDPGSVFIDWKEKAPLSLGQLKDRNGMGDVVTHDAYEDAIDVIRLLRVSYNKDK